MTPPGLQPIDPSFARALDRFDVPAPDAGFLDRMAVMPAVDAPALPPIPRRRLLERGRRGSWARRATIGVIALGLASATAATTGVFSRLHIDIPHIAAILAPTAPPKPKLAKTHHPKPVAVMATSVDAVIPADGAVAGSQLGVDPDRALRRVIRRERVVAVIQNRLAARGIDLPKPVIRRKLIQNRVAIAAAIRGDMTSPLPPRMERARERAAVFLDNHPRLRDRLRRRMEARDLARAARGADAPAAGVDATLSGNGASLAPPPSAQPLSGDKPLTNGPIEAASPPATSPAPSEK